MGITCWQTLSCSSRPNQYFANDSVHDLAEAWSWARGIPKKCPNGDTKTTRLESLGNDLYTGYRKPFLPFRVAFSPISFIRVASCHVTYFFLMFNTKITLCLISTNGWMKIHVTIYHSHDNQPIKVFRNSCVSLRKEAHSERFLIFHLALMFLRNPVCFSRTQFPFLNQLYFSNNLSNAKQKNMSSEILGLCSLSRQVEKISTARGHSIFESAICCDVIWWAGYHQRKTDPISLTQWKHLTW